MGYSIIFQTKIAKLPDGRIIHFDRSGCNNDTAAELKQYFLRRIRSEKIAEKREELRKIWKTQAPHRIKLLNDDKFVEQYIR